MKGGRKSVGISRLEDAMRIWPIVSSRQSSCGLIEAERASIELHGAAQGPLPLCHGVSLVFLWNP